MEKLFSKGGEKVKKNYKKTLLTILFALSLICSFSTISAANNTIGTADSGGISQGIDDTGNGDTLFLNSGTYSKTNDIGINLNKNITIQGNGPADTVIINCEGQNSIFLLNNNLNVTFSNITFKSGYTTMNGGAVNNPNSNTTMTFINCIFINNTGIQGSAIYNSYGNLTVINCNFTNNNGTVIFNIGGSFFCSDSIFTFNEGEYAGGVIYNTGNDCSLVNSTFINNTSIIAGVIINDGDNLRLIDSFFANNTASFGGVIYNHGFGLSIINSTFINNSANASYNGGGVLFNYGANASIDNSCFINNTATLSAGGGVIFNTANNFKISNSNFTGNFAKSGGVIANFYSSTDNAGENFSIFNCNFIANSANSSGVIISNCVNLTIANCNFTNNVALTGSSATITNYAEGLLVINSNFKNNTVIVGSGGAIYNNGGSNCMVFNSTFEDNVVSNFGGAIYNNGGDNFTISNSQFIKNLASYGGAIYNGGNMLVTNNFMTDNSAFTLGNVIYNDGTMGNLNLTYLNNSTLKILINNEMLLFATLTDDMDNPVTGGNISFFVNGEFIGNVTAIEGIGSINFIPTVLGIVPVDGSYDASGAYQFEFYQGQLDVVLKFNTNSTINVLPNPKLGQNINISGIVTDEEGKPIAEVTLNLIINGLNYTVTTNNEGAWNFIHIPNQIGILEVFISWEGNNTHFGFINSTSFEVTEDDSNSTDTNDTNNTNNTNNNNTNDNKIDNNNTDNNNTNNNNTDNNNNNNSNNFIQDDKKEFNTTKAVIKETIHMKKTGIPLIITIVFFLTLLGITVSRKVKK